MLPPALSGWEEQGRRVARSVDDVCAALIAAEDLEAAFHVAIGIARVQALHRRVALGDLVGDREPLVPAADGDPHGLADCFLYGASLNRIGRTLPDSPNIFFLPSGSEPVATEEIFRHQRWRRLTAGFREVEALLLLVADSRTPGIEALASATDGIIAVGAPSLGSLPVIGRIRAPLRVPRAGVPGESLEGTADTSARTAAGEARRRKWRRVSLAAALLVAAAAIGAATVVARVAGDSVGGDPGDARADAVPAPAGVASTAGGALAPSEPGAAAPLEPPVHVANPQDSALATRFAVEVVKANIESAAMAHLRDDSERLPAMTVVPITLSDGSRWFRVLTGAFRDEAAAESLQTALRSTPVLSPDRGAVVEVPFALLSLVAADTGEARAEIASLRTGGLSAYGLLQPDGGVHVYIGAFESPEAAMALDGRAREAGLTPVVVYRLGRSF